MYFINHKHSCISFIFIFILSVLTVGAVASLTSSQNASGTRRNVNVNESSYSAEVNFRRKPRVYGGRVARPNEYTYIAAIYRRVRDTPVFGFTCGGSIYNKNYIVTAGHCLEEEDERIRILPRDLRVVVGQTRISLLLREDSKELLPINETFFHQGYGHTQIYFVDNDLAMLKLRVPLNYTKTVKKLRVASPNESPLDGLGDVVGWGRTEPYVLGRPIVIGNLPENPVSLPLKTARLRIVPRQLCTLRHFAVIPETVLCVGSEGILDTQSACFGDSGGPLACPGPSGPYLCGLVSTGTGCGLRFTPAFYTDVAKYYSWIQSVGGAQ